MSLFGAMSNAVSGLNAQEYAISNISANIANSQTIGYKSVDTSFDTLVNYTGYNATNEAGVASAPEYTNDVSGSLVQSQQATSIAINGNGFFQVKGPATATSGTTETFDTTNYYTRRGDFTADKNGYLVNGAGYTLEGYAVNATTGAVTGTASAPIQVPRSQTSPTPTSLATLVANLPSNYPIQGSSGYTSPSPVTTQIYDAQGNAHTVSVQFDKTAANTWTAQISSGDSVSPQANPVTLQLNFSDGTTDIGSTGTVAPAGTLTSITDISSTANTTTPTISTATSGGEATVGLTFAFGNATQAVSLDLGPWGATGGLTQYSGTSVAVTSQTQNGATAGSLQSTSIDSNGFVDATYSNGQTLKIAQVAIAQFAAPDQLAVESGDAFGETSASGTPTIGAPGANGAGTVSGSTLEQSNVSLSGQLTQLITAQQAYSSNARVITTANQMVQTLNSLIQG